MADKLKEIPGKALEWWNKFTSRQKTIIIAIVAVVVFTFVIIIYTFSRPQYVRLDTYEDSATAAKIVEILNDAGITHKESADARTIDVLKKPTASGQYGHCFGGVRARQPQVRRRGGGGHVHHIR